MSTQQKRVSSEGRTLGEAIRKAAELLSVPPQQVGHEFDRAHFLSASGRSQGAHTVKIFAWATDPVDTAGADAAREWLSGLIKRMGFEANIKVKMTGDKKADLAVSSPNGRHLVGRRGATLHAIQDLMEASVSEEGWSFRIDVLGGDRDRDDRRDRGDRDDRRGGRDRDDRGRGRDRDDRRGGRDRDDRGRGRDRDDRGRGRGRDRGDRGDNRRGRRTPEDVDALRRLAKKLGQRVQESGQSIVVRQELNSFERRIIHVTIGDMDGLETESVMQDDIKRVKITKAGGGGEE